MPFGDGACAHRSFLALIFVGTTMMGVAGCWGGSNGPPIPPGPTGTVKGKVIFDGKPLTEGTLTLAATNGYMVSSPINYDGEFELTGLHGKIVPVGKYVVAVVPPAPDNAPTRPEEMMQKLKDASKKDAGLPAKFQSHRTSGVTVKIEEGDQDVEIQLK